MLEEPELLPEGVLVSAGGVDGIVDGDVDGVVAGGLIGAGVEVLSTFLPQAPSANSAVSATAVTAGLNGTEFMNFPFQKMEGMGRKRFTNLANRPALADETQADRLVGIFRRPPPLLFRF